jgi:hypothetical protein
MPRDLQARLVDLVLQRGDHQGWGEFDEPTLE